MCTSVWCIKGRWRTGVAVCQPRPPKSSSLDSGSLAQSCQPAWTTPGVTHTPSPSLFGEAALGGGPLACRAPGKGWAWPG